MNELFVLEYNNETRSFSIMELDICVSQNREIFMKGQPNPGWLPIFVGSEEECVKTMNMAEVWEETLRTPQIRH